jgi:hypothetical protein
MQFAVGATLSSALAGLGAFLVERSFLRGPR